ncbi:MAG TPA: hypothetical protein VM935_17435 [Chitinophagaceae bacterium]|nr:hypothetical protein [Chitinophagaceae bacterium]
MREPLWMLTKQWQLSELEGDDTSSPVTAKLSAVTTEINKYRAREHSVQAFEKGVPMEAKVEQQPFPVYTLEQDLSLDLRLLMSRRWLWVLQERKLFDDSVRRFFLEHYGFRQPDPTKKIRCHHLCPS